MITLELDSSLMCQPTIAAQTFHVPFHLSAHWPPPHQAQLFPGGSCLFPGFCAAASAWCCLLPPPFPSGTGLSTSLPSHSCLPRSL